MFKIKIRFITSTAKKITLLIDYVSCDGKLGSYSYKISCISLLDNIIIGIRRGKFSLVDT